MEGTNGDPVGYKNPPKNSQFKKGQSGNPKGRPKGVQKQPSGQKFRENHAKDFLVEMDREITLLFDGKPRKMQMVEAIENVMIAKALKGDFRSLKYLLDPWERYWLADAQNRHDLMETLVNIDKYMEETGTEWPDEEAERVIAEMRERIFQ